MIIFVTIRCIIVDDEPLSQDILETYVGDYPGLELCGRCGSALEALDLLRKAAVDLLFLDINMPGLSGINFLRTMSAPPHVILTTAYPEYAIQGFELNVIDYLVKPFSFERWVVAMNKAREKMEAKGERVQQRFIIVKSAKRWIRLDLEEIDYFNSIGDYVKIHTRDGKVVLANETMKHIEEALPGAQFVRVHKSYIVSMGAINYIEGNHLTIGQAIIPVGLTYREELIRRFNIQL